MTPTFFNGAGTEMPEGFAKVPVAYTRVTRGCRQLVVMEGTRTAVAVAWRNNDTCKIGRIQRIPVGERNGVPGFRFKNTFVAFRDCAQVL